MRGGRREGSGRKKKDVSEKKISKTVVISPKLLEQIKTDMSFSQYVTKLIQDDINKKN